MHQNPVLEYDILTAAEEPWPYEKVRRQQAFLQRDTSTVLVQYGSRTKHRSEPQLRLSCEKKTGLMDYVWLFWLHPEGSAREVLE